MAGWGIRPVPCPIIAPSIPAINIKQQVHHWQINGIQILINRTANRPSIVGMYVSIATDITENGEGVEKTTMFVVRDFALFLQPRKVILTTPNCPRINIESMTDFFIFQLPL